jgi:hypothetical protein
MAAAEADLHCTRYLSLSISLVTRPTIQPNLSLTCHTNKDLWFSSGKNGAGGQGTILSSCVILLPLQALPLFLFSFSPLLHFDLFIFMTHSFACLLLHHTYFPLPMQPARLFCSSISNSLLLCFSSPCVALLLSSTCFYILIFILVQHKFQLTIDTGTVLGRFTHTYLQGGSMPRHTQMNLHGGY